jgi:hypothetical protein
MPSDPSGPVGLRTALTDVREPLAVDFARRFSPSGSFALSPVIDPRTVSTAFEAVPLAQTQRVVRQSVTGGLVVPQGTAVDLVVTTSRSITGSVFVDAHPSFQAWNVDEINSGFLSIPAVKNAVDQTTPLTEVQRTALTAALRGVTIQGTTVTLDETDPTKGLDRVLATLRNTSLFTRG